MIFNLEKNNNRNLADIGDLKAYFLKSMLTCKGLSKKTIAAVIAVLDYLETVFGAKQPKSGTVYPLIIQDVFINKEIKRILKKNAKLDKKKSDQVDLDEDANTLYPQFTEDQLNQLQELISSQNEALKMTFEEAVKKISINVVAEPPKAQKEPKTNKSQSSTAKE